MPTPRQVDDLPRLVGRYVRLRPIEPSDYQFLIDLQTSPENLIRWRYRGFTMSPEQIVQGLWNGVLAQFLVVSRETGAPVGLIVCYNAEFRHSYAYLAMIVAPEYESRGWPLEAAGLFVNYVFATFGFRKLYMESVEFNYARLASGAGSWFHVEGCLRDHEVHDRQRWHLYLLAIYAHEWPDVLARVAPHLAAVGGSRPDRPHTR